MLNEVKMEELTAEDMTEEEYFRRKKLERMMTNVPGASGNHVPKRCFDCKYYRPCWKYRTCELTQCRYDPDRDVYRDKPLIDKRKESMGRDV